MKMDEPKDVLDVNEGKGIPYPLIISKLYHRIREATNDYSEDSFYQLLSEIEDIFNETEFARNSGLIEYRSENHDYFLHKKEVYNLAKEKSNKELFLKGFMIRISSESSDFDTSLEENNNDDDQNDETEVIFSQSVLNILSSATPDDEKRYDLFSFMDSEIEIKYFSDDPTLQLRYSIFFNWYLSTLSQFEVRFFLEYHLKHNFKSEAGNFGNFLKLTEAKNNLDSISRGMGEIEERGLVSKQKIKENTQNILDEEEVTKFIKIFLPKIFEREHNDELTSLTRNATAILLQLLLAEGIFINDTKILPATNVFKAFKVLTGYNSQNLFYDVQEFKLEKLDFKRSPEAAKVKHVLKNMIKQLESGKI
jgi:hypothetical protein